MGSHLWSLARQVGALGPRKPRVQILNLLEAGLPDCSRTDTGSKANGKVRKMVVQERDHSTI